MRLFTPCWTLLDDDALINCKFSWVMPGAKCPACGTDGDWPGAIHYPQVDLSGQPDFKRWVGDKWRHHSVDWSEFERLRNILRPLLPKGLPVGFQTAFGTTTGRVKASVKSDVLHSLPWTMLLTTHALEKMLSAGVSLASVISSVKKPGQNEAVYDIFAPACARLAKECVTTGSYCPTCFSRIPVPNGVLVDRASIPKDTDVFRCQEVPGALLLTERFVKVLEDHSLTGLSVSEVAVA